MRLGLAPAARIPPAGLQVTTVVDGIKRTVEAGQPTQPAREEQPMPRGVYERKPKKQSDKPAAKRGRKPRAKGGFMAPAGTIADILAGMRKKRDALDAAIKALEAL